LFFSASDLRLLLTARRSALAIDFSVLIRSARLILVRTGTRRSQGIHFGFGFVAAKPVLHPAVRTGLSVRSSILIFTIECGWLQVEHVVFWSLSDQILKFSSSISYFARDFFIIHIRCSMKYL
jgi:hypothetical protein